jgi:hypothetical protein
LVAPLHWSDPRIATLIHTFVEIEMRRRHMMPLDVCKKLKEWASTGYKEVPTPMPVELQGTLGRRWVRAVTALGCLKSPMPPQDVSAALRPYRHAGAQPSTRSVELLEARLAPEEVRASLGAKRSLFDALGVSPLLTTRSRHHRRRGGPETAPAELPACTGTPELRSK